MTDCKEKSNEKKSARDREIVYVCEREGGRKSVFFLERQGKVRNLQATLSEKRERGRGGE